MTRTLPPQLPAVVALGVGCQIGQILLLREFLTVFHGSELSIGIVLAIWMLWTGIGSRWGARLAERSPHPASVLRRHAFGILVLLPAILAAVRGLRGFFNVLPGAYLSLGDMTLSCLLLMAPVCLLLGAQFVLLARLWRERDRAADASAAGKAYIAEAAGTILGGVLFTFLLVRWTNAFQSAFLAGLLMMAGTIPLRGLPAAGSGTRRKGAPGLAWVALPLAFAAAWPILGFLDAWTHRVQWTSFAPDHQLIATHRSKYGALVVARREDQYSFFQSGHRLFSAAGPEARSPGLEEQEGAVFAHLSMVQHPDPKRVLLIGGGLRGTLREIARHPVERIDYVELDDALIAAARPHLSPATLETMDGPRVRLRHVDGRLFVKAADESYDIILVDVPDPATAVLNRYYTVEFFREAAARLNPGGVLVVGVTSTPDLRGSAAANRSATVYHTLKSVFAHVLPAGERLLLFFASQAGDRISVDPERLRARYLERAVDTEAFSPGHFEVLLQDGPLRRVNWILRHHGRGPRAHLDPPEPGPLFPGPIEDQEREERSLPPAHRRTFINSDFRPVGYYYTLLFWNVLARKDHAGWLQWIARVESWWILPPAAAVLLAAWILRRTGPPGADLRFAVGIAVFTTGMSTMALQIALLLSFQSVYGFVYERIGLIVAIFMGGLLAGAAATRRRAAAGRPGLLAGVQGLLAASAALIAVALPWAAAITVPAAVFALFAALTFAAGLLNGLDFPIATACAFAMNRRAEKSVGMVYGIELLGACAGAMLAGAIVAPVLGIAACCMLASLANAVAFGVLMIARRTHASHGA